MARSRSEVSWLASYSCPLPPCLPLDLPPKKKKLGKNPDVDTSFLPDRDREVGNIDPFMFNPSLGVVPEYELDYDSVAPLLSVIFSMVLPFPASPTLQNLSGRRESAKRRASSGVGGQTRENQE